MIKRKTHIGRNILCLFADQNSMLDIIADSTSIKKQGGKLDVTMTDKEWKFLNNQRQNPPIGRCESFVERWEIAQKRRQKRENRVHNQSFEESFQVADEADIQSSLGEEDNSEVSTQLAGDKIPENDEAPPKKKMYVYSHNLPYNDADNLPYQYRHIRSGPRSVKPEYYIVKSIFQSQSQFNF